MHDHECRYCGRFFICEIGADECFQTSIVCGTCFWNHDFRHFLLVVLLAVIALAATVYLFREMKKPAFTAPVSNYRLKTTTGEKYYDDAEETNQTGNARRPR